MASEDIQIYLNSYYGLKRNTGNSADTDFYIPNINVDDGYYIYISLASATIPYSFYNITSLNNTLTYYITNGIQTTITITEGNYNIEQLISYINIKLTNTGLSISYSKITNKVTFAHTTTSYYITGLLFIELLGFTSGVLYNSNLLSVTSPFCINLHNNTSINVETSLSTYNISNIPNMKQNRSILANIPITCAPFNLIIYKDANKNKCNIYMGQLNKISIRLLDNKGNLLNMNGMDYELILQIDVIPFQ